MTIKRLAIIIGSLVAAAPAVQYSKIHIKSLEAVRFKALLTNNDNYNATCVISDEATEDLRWWSKTIFGPPLKIRSDIYDKIIYTDASDTGWGAHHPPNRACGWWSPLQQGFHINVKELTAVLLALRTFADKWRNVSILLRVDNVTAISVVNKFGSVRFSQLHKLAKEIWSFCEQRQLWIFASYITTKDNVIADFESRRSLNEAEWGITEIFYKQITDVFGTPQIDLFASYDLHLCERFCSWQPQIGAEAVDAFTLDWNNLHFIAFPPFALIDRVLKKIRDNEAEGIVIVPQWPSQPFYTTFYDMLLSDPVILGPHVNLLFSPYTLQPHPLATSLSLMAGILSGRHGKRGDYLTK